MPHVLAQNSSGSNAIPIARTYGRIAYQSKVTGPQESIIKGSKIIQGDASVALLDLPDKFFQTCITSPPYWGLRDYGVDGQVGAESTIDEYVDGLVQIFNEVSRVLRDDGTLWLNIGDSYTSGGRKWRAPDKKLPQRGMNYRPDTPAGLKPKDLIGVPWRVAFALQSAGWYLRSEIIWHKPNALPESVTDRPVRNHEHLFLLTKRDRYFYDREATRIMTASGGRYKRSVWSINTESFKGAHFATFPPKLVEPCVKAGSRIGDFVLDPFFGAGTVGVVATQLNRKYVGIELHEEYVEIAQQRIESIHPVQLQLPD